MRTAILCVLFLAAPAAAADNPVRGVVSMDGQPLAGATIKLHPADPKAKPVEAKTNDEGAFAMKDVPAGEYKVTAEWLVEAKGGDPKDPKKINRLPARYADPKTSGITATVKAGENTIDLQLRSK